MFLQKNTFNLEFSGDFLNANKKQRLKERGKVSRAPRKCCVPLSRVNYLSNVLWNIKMFCILCGPWSVLRVPCHGKYCPCWMFRVTSSVVRFTKSVFRFTSSVVRVPCSVRPVFRVHGFSCPKIHCL